MTHDTSTAEGRAKRLAELGGGYTWSQMRRAFNLSDDDRDYIPGRDDGEPPQGAKWN